MAQDKVIKKGRIRYIEPTSLSKDGLGTSEDRISFPYEDYSMAVDLSVQVTDRYSCGWWKETGGARTISFSSSNGTISFLGGSKIGEDNFLTVNYTDVDLSNPDTNTSECLGIESIDITYNSWMYPQVNIKFIDLRGATIMCSAEKGYYNNDDSGNASQLYKALFSFPYPIFTLKVKGYYGKGVTYKLAIEKTSIEFDSVTGNFYIRASFIGYMYGIYSDIPMTYLAIAPYLPEGKKYWNNKKHDGTFTFKDENGNEQSQMLTIPELRLRLAEASKNAEVIKTNSDAENIQNAFDEQISKLNELIEAFPFKGWHSSGSSKNNLYNVVSDSENPEMLVFEGIRNFLLKVYEYDKAYSTNFLSLLLDGNIKNEIKEELDDEDNPDYEDIFEDKIIFISYKMGDDSYYRCDEDCMDDYHKYHGIYSDVEKFFNSHVIGKSSMVTMIVVLKKYFKYNEGEFCALIKDEEKKIKDFSNETVEYYRRVQEETIEKFIGFRPSVKNIFDLMFAHMDTFTHCFYESTKRIKSQLNETDSPREKRKFQLKDGETDTERASGTSSRGNFLPPYTGFFKEETKDSVKKMVMRWPEEIYGGSNLEEVHFIKRLLQATEMYFEDSINVEESIAAMSSTSADTESVSDAIGAYGDNIRPSIGVREFFPLTMYDLVYKDNVDNPYIHIRDKVTSQTIGFESLIVGTLALRGFLFASQHGSDDDLLEAFGQMEAINFFKAIGDKVTPAFREFLKKSEDLEDDTDDIVDKLLENYPNEINRAWTSNAPNLNQALFAMKGKNNIIFNLHKGMTVTDVRNDGFVESSLISGNITSDSYKAKKDFQYKMMPLYFANFNDMIGDYVNEKNLLNNPQYLTSKYEVEEAYGGVNNRVSTFHIIENRDYLSNVFDEIRNEMSRAAGKKVEVYGKRKPDEYGETDVDVAEMEVIYNFVDEDFYKDFYIEGTVVKIEDDELEDYDENPFSADYDTQSSLYIKFPTIGAVKETFLFQINKYTNHIFSTDIYKLQQSNEAKAYIFLNSLPIYGKEHNKVHYGNGACPKVKLLLDGAHYWKEMYPYEIRIPNQHIRPSASQTFKDRDQENDLPCFTVFKNGEGSYLTYEPYTYGCSEGKKKSLINYFITWANSLNERDGFAANAKRLEKDYLYMVEDQNKYLDILKLHNKTTPQGVEFKQIQEFLRGLFFGVCTTFDFLDKRENGEFECKKIDLETIFDGFFDQLNEIYEDMTEDLLDEPEIFNENIEKANKDNAFENKDLRLSTYMTLKSLYDKWLCSPYKGAKETWAFHGGKGGESDFDNFIYIDTYYHDIGYTLNANISKISQWLSDCLPTSNVTTGEGVSNYNGKTLYQFLSQVAQDCGAMLLAVPQKFGIKTGEDVAKMFTPLSFNDGWDDDTSTFILMYTYKPSTLLGDKESGKMDMNGWSPDGNGVDLTDDEITGKLFYDNGYEIPAFGVTYAKGNQSIFKNITLNSEGAGVTEASLKSTYDIASKSSESPRESTFYGQDLYRVYSEYSYKCSVTMLGNMQIFPLMYFQLNNIPMWKGAYNILKVSHSISYSDITTTMEGVRINRFAIPLSNSAVITVKNTGTQEDGNSSGSTVEGATQGNTNGGWMSNNGSNTNNVTPNPNQPINDTTDFDEKNITKEKPLICITPAHGPNSQKKQEWGWSSKLVDRIVEILKTYTFKDGSSYSTNIQRCNKGGKHTGKGYSTIETQNLINKYGSDKVISVVPHWNGAGGNYHGVFVNKLSAGVREDSQILAECMVSEMEIVKSKKDTLTMPVGMMDGKVRLLNLGENNTDGAPNLKCACILTENWFADYPKNCAWSNDSVYQDKDENGKYKTGRGWLESDEGIEELAQAHARGIKRYIDTLS